MKVRILPYLEGTNAYNSVNFNVTAIWSGPGGNNQVAIDGYNINYTIRHTKVNSYVCPSDTNDPGSGNDPQSPPTSYGECRGLNRYNSNWVYSGMAYYQGHDAPGPRPAPSPRSPTASPARPPSASGSRARAR